jgi:hypothetical protein
MNLLKGNSALRGHLRELKLGDGDSCMKCRREKEYVVSKRLRYLEDTFMNPGDFSKFPIMNLADIVESTALTTE